MLIFLTIWTYMKNNLKYIAISVVFVMACLFAYQCWWLIRMYRNEVAKTESAVRTALRTSDFNEMAIRLRKISEQNADLGLKGDIVVGAGYGEEGTSILHTSTTQYQMDTLSENLDKGDKGLKTISKTTKSVVKKQSEDGAGRSDMFFESLENMSLQVVRGIHTGIDAVDADMDFRLFDSLLVVYLKEAGLDGRHRVALMSCADSLAHNDDTAVENREMKERRVISTEGYIPSSKAVSFEYCFNAQESAMYKLWIEPVGRAVLRQMSGILAASVLILMVLVAVFCYLIHVIRTLKSLDEMKSDFTNNMTHELKTPISVAYAANDALLNFPDGDSPELRRKYLEISRSQLENLSGLVEQVLSMSMERRKGLVLHKEDIGLSGLVYDIVGRHSMKAEKPTAFTVEIPEEMTVSADRLHLSNVLNNLLDNAMKYSGESVDICISADKERIEVRDNGNGISEHDLLHIFEKFYRAHTGNVHDVKGYGLGLYYVKSIVEKHGWSISAYSEPGKGTAFVINLK